MPTPPRAPGSANVGNVAKRWSQAGIGQESETAVLVEVDDHGLPWPAVQEKGDDAVVAGAGVALGAGVAVEDEVGALRVDCILRGGAAGRVKGLMLFHGHILQTGCDSPAGHPPPTGQHPALTGEHLFD